MLVEIDFAFLVLERFENHPNLYFLRFSKIEHYFIRALADEMQVNMGYTCPAVLNYAI